MSTLRVIAIESDLASDAAYLAECEARRSTRSRAAKTRRVVRSVRPCKHSVGGTSFSVLVELFGLRESAMERPHQPHGSIYGAGMRNIDTTGRFVTRAMVFRSGRELFLTRSGALKGRHDSTFISAFFGYVCQGIIHAEKRPAYEHAAASLLARAAKRNGSSRRVYSRFNATRSSKLAMALQKYDEAAS